MAEPLNILFTSSWFPSRVHPTLGNFVQRHAEAAALHHRVHVLYLAYDAQVAHAPEIEDYTGGGVSITVVYYNRKPAKALARWKALRAGIRHLESSGHWPFDLVHHHVLWPEVWQAIVLRKRFQLPVILTEHWTGFLSAERGPLPTKIRLYARWASRFVHVFLPVTRHLGDQMQAAGVRGKFYVVPNVVNTQIFQPGKKQQRPIRFLHVSSLDERHKNISGILKAWKHLAESRKDVHLEIGGDGPSEVFAALAHSMQIPEGSISFFSEMPWESIAQKMSEAHVLVMFSNFENLPCVIVEALASGMRIVSSRVGGIAEHIDPSRGTLVDPRNLMQLTEALRAEADLAAQIDRSALRAYAEDHFSQQAVAGQLNTIYRRTLQRVWKA